MALSAYCAAGIAKSNPMTTGYTAFKLGFIAFLIPFIAFFSPALLFEGGSFGATVYTTVTCLVMLFTLAFATSGHGFKRKLSWIERILFFVASGFAIVPNNYITFAIGCAVMAVGLTTERLITIKDSTRLAD